MNGKARKYVFKHFNEEQLIKDIRSLYEDYLNLQKSKVYLKIINE